MLLCYVTAQCTMALFFRKNFCFEVSLFVENLLKENGNLNNWLAIRNLRIALKKAVFALGFEKLSVTHNS